MVYFNCDACGESLKKSQVEKHRYKCRNCRVVSCVDCGNDFRGNEYESHTKCISEEEKYSGKNYTPKANANKGEVKQEQWTQQVQQAIDKASDPKLQNILQQLRSYSNIPRKKAKFENFLQNSLHLRNDALVSKVWEAISAEILSKGNECTSAKDTAVSDTETSGSTAEQNGHQESTHTEDLALRYSGGSRKSKKRRKDKSGLGDQADICSEVGVHADAGTTASDGATKSETKKKKRKHRENLVNIDDFGGSEAVADDNETRHGKHKKTNKKHKHNGDVQSADSKGDSQNTDDDFCKQMNASTGNDSYTTEVVHHGKFKWHPVIIDILQQVPSKQLPVKKLRKKVLSEFNARLGDGKVYTKEKLLATFTRKVNKCARLKVHKDIVTLLD